MRNRSFLLVLAWLAGCHGEEVRIEQPARSQRYRPAWLVTVPDHVPALRACLDGRKEPRFVVFVEPLSQGTGVSTLDADGAVEHCAWSDGQVVRREPTSLTQADFVGLPVFSLGPTIPLAPTGILLEEVLESETSTLGWVYWLPKGDAAAGGEVQSTEGQP